MKQIITIFFIAFCWFMTFIVTILITGGSIDIKIVWHSLIYFPTGILSAILLLIFLNKVQTKKQKTCIVIGYILLYPWAFLVIHWWRDIPEVIKVNIFAIIILLGGLIGGTYVGTKLFDETS